MRTETKHLKKLFMYHVTARRHFCGAVRNLAYETWKLPTFVHTPALQYIPSINLFFVRSQLLYRKYQLTDENYTTGIHFLARCVDWIPRLHLRCCVVCCLQCSRLALTQELAPPLTAEGVDELFHVHDDFVSDGMQQPALATVAVEPLPLLEQEHMSFPPSC